VTGARAALSLLRGEALPRGAPRRISSLTMTYREGPRPVDLLRHGAVVIDRDSVREFEDGVETLRIPRAKVLSLRVAYGFTGERIPLLLAVGVASLVPFVAVARVLLLASASTTSLDSLLSVRQRGFAMPVFLLMLAGFCFHRALQRGTYLSVKTPGGVRKLPFRTPEAEGAPQRLIEEAQQHFGYTIDDAP